MITLKQNDPGVPIETTMTLAGEEFPITLLPLPLKDQAAAFNKFRKRKNVPNPMSGKMELVDYFDDKDPDFQKAAEDLLDKHVVTFSKIAGPDGELDGSQRASKILLGSVRVDDFENIRVIDPETKEEAVIPRPRTRYFRSMIFDKCNELAETIAEAERKN
jgi:hypothetical protein